MALAIETKDTRYNGVVIGDGQKQSFYRWDGREIHLHGFPIGGACVVKDQNNITTIKVEEVSDDQREKIEVGKYGKDGISVLMGRGTKVAIDDDIKLTGE